MRYRPVIDSVLAEKQLEIPQNNIKSTPKPQAANTNSVAAYYDVKIGKLPDLQMQHVEI